MVNEKYNNLYAYMLFTFIKPFCRWFNLIVTPLREKLSRKDITFLAQVHGASNWLDRTQISLLLLGSESFSAFNKQVLMKHSPSSLFTQPSLSWKKFQQGRKENISLWKWQKDTLENKKIKFRLDMRKDKWRLSPQAKS